MKKGKKLLALLLALAVVMAGAPYGMEVQAEEYFGDYEYEVNADGKSVTITDYNAGASTSDLVIPPVIDGKNVTAIGHGAFIGCENLTEVKIPQTVTNIEDVAFMDCSNLKTVTIPDSVTSIGQGAFESCGIISLTIPANVSHIGSGAFSRNKAMESITVSSKNKVYDSRNNCNAVVETATNTLVESCKKTVIPNTVVTIGYLAFYGCSMSEVTIPAGVKNIADSAFYGGLLKRVTISGSVTDIGPRAFCYCENLENVTIPNSVKSIGEFAFVGCRFKSVTIPNSVTKIGMKAFGFYHPGGEEGLAKIPGFCICGGTGTAAEKYAKDHAFVFKAIAQQNSTITCKKKNYELTYSKGKSFQINASSSDKMTFTSSDNKVVVVDKSTGKVTVKGYGIAVVTIKAGTESVKVKVKVNPKKLTVKSAKTLKGRKLTVKWPKDKMATGYQVQVSLTKNFKKVAKNQKVTKNAKDVYTFTKLKAGKKYYVRARSYKKSKAGTVYGAWSKVKVSGKIKK